VLPLLDEVSEPARTIGAVNTVIFAGGRRLGDNTDAPGLAAAVRSSGAAAAGSVTVLGGGATGRSALAAAASLRIPRADVVVRSVGEHADRLAELAGTLGITVDVHPWPSAADLLPAPLVVSTVPVGVAAQFCAVVPAAPGVLFDVLYAPWPTPLAAAWDARGGTVIGGFELLLEQAALQVAAMTGRPAPVAAMRAAGLAALAAR
jgi:shikimate dehydrogenase